MRPRSFTLNTLEIVIPVALAAILAVGAFLFLNPVFGQGQTANPGVIRIYASLPRPDYDSIVHGVQMAIDEVNSKAGTSASSSCPSTTLFLRATAPPSGTPM